MIKNLITFGSFTLMAACFPIKEIADTSTHSLGTGNAGYVEPYQCDYESATNRSEFLKIPKSRFHDQCFAPRAHKDYISVAVPQSADEYLTRCAVTLTARYAPPDHDCFIEPSRRPFADYDKFMINDWGPGAGMMLTRLRDGLIIALQPVEKPGAGFPYLIGSHDGLTYAVYLSHGDLDPEKKIYLIEVFDDSASECLDHKPTPDSALVACPTPEIDPWTVESGTSTGGEPPPHG